MVVPHTIADQIALGDSFYSCSNLLALHRAKISESGMPPPLVFRSKVASPSLGQPKEIPQPSAYRPPRPVAQPNLLMRLALEDLHPTHLCIYHHVCLIA
jgi:hypothetical protein